MASSSFISPEHVAHCAGSAFLGPFVVSCFSTAFFFFSFKTHILCPLRVLDGVAGTFRTNGTGRSCPYPDLAGVSVRPHSPRTLSSIWFQQRFVLHDTTQTASRSVVPCHNPPAGPGPCTVAGACLSHFVNRLMSWSLSPPGTGHCFHSLHKMQQCLQSPGEMGSQGGGACRAPASPADELLFKGCSPHTSLRLSESLPAHCPHDCY